MKSGSEIFRHYHRILPDLCSVADRNPQMSSWWRSQFTVSEMHYNITSIVCYGGYLLSTDTVELRCNAVSVSVSVLPQRFKGCLHLQCWKSPIQSLAFELNDMAHISISKCCKTLLLGTNLAFYAKHCSLTLVNR